MTDLNDAFKLSASGMHAQAMRLRHISENIANIDTPGYRRKLVTFRESMSENAIEIGPVRLDKRELLQSYEPGHPLANEAGLVEGSNVDINIEMADAREAHRSYNANLLVFDQSRKMTQSIFDLLRR